MIAGRVMIPVIKIIGFIHNHRDFECTMVILYLISSVKILNLQTQKEQLQCFFFVFFKRKTQHSVTGLKKKDQLVMQN